MVLLKLPVFFESDESLQKKDLALDNVEIEDYEVSEVNFFSMPDGYYVRDFHGRDVVSVMYKGRDFMTILSEEVFLKTISDTLESILGEEEIN